MKIDVTKAKQCLNPLAEASGLELIDIKELFEDGERVLRLLINKPGGVVIADCARFSKQAKAVLLEKGVFGGDCHFEVSSPGIDTI